MTGEGFSSYRRQQALHRFREFAEIRADSRPNPILTKQG